MYNASAYVCVNYFYLFTCLFSVKGKETLSTWVIHIFNY